MPIVFLYYYHFGVFQPEVFGFTDKWGWKWDERRSIYVCSLLLVLLPLFLNFLSVHRYFFCCFFLFCFLNISFAISWIKLPILNSTCCRTSVLQKHGKKMNVCSEVVIWRPVTLDTHTFPCSCAGCDAFVESCSWRTKGGFFLLALGSVR